MPDLERSDRLQLVAFTLDTEEYAVPVELVESIIRTVDLTPVPGAPAHVRGVMNLRGKVISVIDLRHRFGMTPATADTGHRILVVRFGDSVYGILVDNVSEVFTLADGSFQAPPPGIGGDESSGIDGVIHVGERLIVLIRLESVLGGLEATPIERATAGESRRQRVSA